MPSLDFTILYVADPVASASFYADLLDRPPIETSPTFVMFAFDNKAMLGLWRRDGVVPPVEARPGGSELAFVVADDAAVDAAHADWFKKDYAIEQEPTALDFGYSAVVLDPDGHRIRVMKPGM